MQKDKTGASWASEHRAHTQKREKIGHVTQLSEFSFEKAQHH
jgi:hypothetical protein